MAILERLNRLRSFLKMGKSASTAAAADGGGAAASKASISPIKSHSLGATFAIDFFKLLKFNLSFQRSYENFNSFNETESMNKEERHGRDNIGKNNLKKEEGENTPGWKKEGENEPGWKKEGENVPGWKKEGDLGAKSEGLKQGDTLEPTTD